MSRFRILERIIAAEFAKLYEPGKADCFFFGLATIDALAGTALVTKYAGSYKTLAGAHKALVKRGHGSIADLFATHLERIGPARAALGDIVVLRLPDGAEHVAVCVGAKFLTKTAAGKSFHDLAECVAAFRVPDGAA